MKIALFNYPLASLGGGARHMLAIAQALATHHEVHVLHEGRIQPEDAARRLNLSLDNLHLRALPLTGDVAADNNIVSDATRDYDLFINSSYRFPFPRARRNAFFTYFPNAIDLRPAARVRWWLGQRLGATGRRMLKVLPVARPLLQRLNGLPTRADLNAFAAYEQFFCNSRYTQTWVRHIWRRESTVIYPLVTPITATKHRAARQPAIVSVGRFFRYNGATKRHEVLVRAFRQMVDAGLAGWTLHLVGGLNKRIGDSETYLAELREMARGYPIELHVDAPWHELTSILDSSALYWHAMGYGEDLQHVPDRAEHFGITTVEAMSAGCVPVVIDAGGQPEIVQDGANGFLWRTLDELQAKTLRVIQDMPLREQLAHAAQASSQRFCDAEAFRAHVLKMMAALLAARP